MPSCLVLGAARPIRREAKPVSCGLAEGMLWWIPQSGHCSRTVRRNHEPNPQKSLLMQDMNQPLSAYFVDTSHNTYLEATCTSRTCIPRFSGQRSGVRNHCSPSFGSSRWRELFCQGVANCSLQNPRLALILRSVKRRSCEGNQLSSRSSVLRYVEVLRTGCRSVEAVWDFCLRKFSNLSTGRKSRTMSKHETQGHKVFVPCQNGIP